MIIEPNPVRRLGLRLVIERNAEFSVTGEVQNTDDAKLEQCAAPTDVVVLRCDRVSTSVLESLQYIKNATKSNLLLLVRNLSEEDIAASKSAGATAVCPEIVSVTELHLALHAVAMGDERLYKGMNSRGSIPAERSDIKGQASNQNGSLLTIREIEVVRLLMLGLSNPEIAERLSVSRQTVKAHLRNIMKKLQVSDRIQIFIGALRLGLLGNGS